LARPSLILQRSVIALILLCAAVYAGDYLVVRWKMTHPKAGAAFGTVKMVRLLAIPMKDGKTEYELDAQQPEVIAPCVHALLPHMGNSPCWYLQRNSQKPIPM
jgi:hypothetical protein